MDQEQFTKQIVEVIAKRAANICSNPDCGVLTCGPADEMDRSVIIGEAAHIFGARLGSARFSESMSPAERGDVTNAIWLCRNCHKLIDADPVKFPADMLFEWRRQHEEEIAKRVGKPSDIIRRKILARQLVEFESCSYLAQQIVIDKPDHWEYKLTIELLRTRMAPLLRRWQALEKGLYTKPAVIVTIAEIGDWFQARFSEIQKIADAFSGLVNDELPRAWGAPSEPGSETEILQVCDLLVECAQRVVQWGETTCFAALPSEFDEAQALLMGSARSFIEQLARIPKEMGAIFDQDRPSGVHKISLVLTLPDEWSDKFRRAVKRAYDRVAERR